MHLPSPCPFLHRIPYSPRGVRSSRGSRTLVLSRRRMNWKFDFSPETSDIFAVWWRCRGLSEGREASSHFAAPWRLCAGSHDRVRAIPPPLELQVMKAARAGELHVLTSLITCVCVKVVDTGIYETRYISLSMVCIPMSVSHYHVMHILLSLNRLPKTPFSKPILCI
jgi:hypothetical protein